VLTSRPVSGRGHELIGDAHFTEIVVRDGLPVRLGCLMATWVRATGRSTEAAPAGPADQAPAGLSGRLGDPSRRSCFPVPGPGQATAGDPCLVSLRASGSGLVVARAEKTWNSQELGPAGDAVRGSSRPARGGLLAGPPNGLAQRGGARTMRGDETWAISPGADWKVFLPARGHRVRSGLTPRRRGTRMFSGGQGAPWAGKAGRHITALGGRGADVALD